MNPSNFEEFENNYRDGIFNFNDDTAEKKDDDTKKDDNTKKEKSKSKKKIDIDETQPTKTIPLKDNISEIKPTNANDEKELNSKESFYYNEQYADFEDCDMECMEYEGFTIKKSLSDTLTRLLTGPYKFIVLIVLLFILYLVFDSLSFLVCRFFKEVLGFSWLYDLGLMRSPHCYNCNPPTGVAIPSTAAPATV